MSRVMVWLFPFALLAMLLAAVSTANAADSSPGRAAIAEILTTAKGWAVLIEFTPESKPTDRANKAGFEFFWRDSEIVGRTTNLLPGMNCEFRVVLRDNGFDFQAPRGCGGYSESVPLTSVEYDPEDATFPFKRLTAPMKMVAYAAAVGGGHVLGSS